MCSVERTEASQTTKTPSGNWGAAAAATASASAVFPTPPGPVTVVNGVNAMRSISSTISKSLPTSRRARNAVARWPSGGVPSCPSLVPPVALAVILAASQDCRALARVPGASRVATSCNVETQLGCHKSPSDRAERNSVRTVRECLWPQPVIATAPLNASDGDIQPSVCRGRPLSDRAMALSCDCVTVDMSVFLGRY